MGGETMASKKINGITIAINADTKGVTNGLKDLTDQSITLSKQLKSVDALLKLDPENTELLAKKQELLAQSVDVSRQRLEALRGAQEDVKASVESGSIGTDEYIAFQRELITTEQRMKELEKQSEGTGDEMQGLGNQTEEAGDQMQETEKESGRLGEKLKSVLAAGAEVAKKALEATVAAIGAATTAAIGFAKDAVQVGMSFDAAVSQIGATLGYTAEDLSKSTSDASKNLEMLRNKAQEMGAATSFSATEAAEGLNILAMSGYSAEQSCEMIGDVLNLAAAGGLSLAEAASYTSGAVKGFADASKDAQYYTDLMAKGATLANTDVKALGEALSGGSATAASYGQTADGLTLSLLRMAEQGVTGSDAANALSRAMADIYTPTDGAKKAMEALGVSAYTTSGEARDFNTVADELNKKLATMSDEEANAYKNALFSSRGLQAFNKMTVTSTEKVNEWSDALADASGSAAAQAETMLDNLQGDITVFGSAMEGAKIVLSDSLTPALRDFVKFGTRSVSTLTDAFKNGGLTGAISALGPIMDELIEKVSDTIPAIIAVASEIVTALADQVPTLLDALLPPLISGVTQVMTALAKQLPSIFRVLANAMPALIDAFTSVLPLIAETAVQLISELAHGLAKSLPTLVPQVVGIIKEIVNILTDKNNLDALIDAAIAILTELSKALVDNLPELVDAALTLITRLVEYLLDPENIDKLVTASFEIIVNLAKALVDSLWKIGEACGQIVKKIVDALGLGEYWEAGMDVIDKFMGGVKQKWDEWKHWWEGFGEAVYDYLHGTGGDEPLIDESKVWKDPRYSAKGGVFTVPTRAIIGENGAEVVLPLENNTGWMDILAAKLAAIGGSGMNIGAITVNVTGTENAGMETVQSIDEALRQYQLMMVRGTGGVSW